MPSVVLTYVLLTGERSLDSQIGVGACRPDCRSVSRGGARIARGPLENRRRQGYRRDDEMWREDVRADRRTADQGARRRPARRAQPRQGEEIGRASCRERECTYG